MPVIKNLIVRVGADASGMQQGFATAKKSLQSLEQNLKRNMDGISRQLNISTAAIRSYGSSTELQKQKVQGLSSSFDLQRTHLKGLISEYFNAKKVFGESSTQAMFMKDKMLAAATVESKLKDEVAQATLELNKQESALRQSNAFEKYKNALSEVERSTVKLKTSLIGTGTLFGNEQANIDGLNNKLLVHRNYFKSVGKEYAIHAKSYGKNSESAQKLKSKLIDLSLTEANLKNDIATANNQLVIQKTKLNSLSEPLNKVSKKFTLLSTNVRRAMAAIAIGIGLAFSWGVKNSTQAAMQVESSIQQIKRVMGESSNQFLKWAKDSALAFNMSKQEALKYGNVYGNLIAGFSSSNKDILTNTQDLLKASAIVASGTGRTMEDVMERIRSGLLGNTEAIEDLGIYAQVGMLKTTDAFKKFAKGKSWDQLSYQTQQQIRLFSILEQVHNRFGDEVMNNTISSQLQLAANLKNVQLNLGNAFLPIYQFILPALNALASKIAYVTNIFAQFMQALFGKAQSSSTQGTTAQTSAVSELGDAYDEAGKKASQSVAGFDEVNSLSTGSGGEGMTNTDAAIGNPLESTSGFDDSKIVDISSKVQQAADKVKQAFSDMKSTISENETVIKASLGGIATAFAIFTIGSNWGTIINGIKTALSGLAAVIAGISLPVLLVAAAIGLLVGGFIYFYQTNEQFRGIVNEIFDSIKVTLTNLWNNVLVPFGEYLSKGFSISWQMASTAASWLWKNVLVPIGDYLKWFWQNVLVPISSILKDVFGVAFTIVGTIAKSFWKNVLVPLGAFISEVFGPATEALSAVFNHLWLNVLSPFGSFLSLVLKVALSAIVERLQFMWNNVLKPLSIFIGGIFATTFDNTFKTIGEVIDNLKTVFIGLMTYITGVFTGDWEKAWNGVRDIFGGVFGALYSLVKTPLNLIIESINKVIEGLSSIKISIPSWVPNIGGQSWGISIPSIPKLASGGITNGPMTALIGDNVGGREVVSPLDDLMDMMTSAVGTALMQASQFNQTGSSDKEIVLKIKDTEIARAIMPALDKERGRIGYVALQGG